MSTIKDVALKANVSVTTVSRVLNNNGYVHKDTKEIITKAIKELNYYPNLQSEYEGDENKPVIGILINTIPSTTSSKLLDSLQQYCKEKGYKTILAITRNSQELEKYYLELFKKHNVSGIVFAEKINTIVDFISLKKPMVSINFKICNSIPSILTNNDSAIELAFNEFKKNNCKKILLVKYNVDDFNKYNKLCNLLKESNIEVNTINVEKKINKNILYETIKKSEFDGIYTTSDLIAIPTMTILQQMKISIPKNCSVISYDNSPFSTLIWPSLTSIDYPVEKLASTAITTINSIITKENYDHQVIDVELILRESTKRE